MWKNIKSFLEDETLFFAALIVLVAIASFGLGRVSVTPIGSNSQIAGVHMTESGISTETERESGRATIQEKRFVGSKNSDKYHLPHCSGASRIKEENKIWFETEDEARRAGYVPAANCEGI